MRPAIFVDKDGTLIPDIPYNVDPRLITLSSGAGEALRKLKGCGYLLVIVSNQSGVARGLFSEDDLVPVWERLHRLLADYRVEIDGIHYCPHHPDAVIERYAMQCDCRKPQPGLLINAAWTLNIDLRRSWMIGDIAADSEAGNRAGCRTILIEKPYDPILKVNEASQPDFIAESWAQAGEIILRHYGKHHSTV